MFARPSLREQQLVKALLRHQANSVHHTSCYLLCCAKIHRQKKLKGERVYLHHSSMVQSPQGREVKVVGPLENWSDYIRSQKQGAES